MQINVCHVSGAVFYSDTQNKTPRIFPIGVQIHKSLTQNKTPRIFPIGVQLHRVSASCAVFYSDTQNKTPRIFPIGLQFQSVSASGAVFYSEKFNIRCKYAFIFIIDSFTYFIGQSLLKVRRFLLCQALENLTHCDCL